MSTARTIVSTIVAATLLGSTACGPKAAPSGSTPAVTPSEAVPAVVNGEPIPKARFERRLAWRLELAKREGKSNGTSPDRAFWSRTALDELISETVTAQEAAKEGLSIFPAELDEAVVVAKAKQAIPAAPACEGEDEAEGDGAVTPLDVTAALSDDEIRTDVERAMLVGRMQREVECGLELDEDDLKLAFRGRHEWIELDYIVFSPGDLDWEQALPRLESKNTTLAAEAGKASLQVSSIRMRPNASELWGIADPDLVENAAELSADNPVLYVHGGLPEVGDKIYLAVFRNREEPEWSRFDAERKEIRAQALQVKRARAWLDWRRRARARATVSLYEPAP